MKRFMRAWMVPYIGTIDKPAPGTSLSTIEAQCAAVMNHVRWRPRVRVPSGENSIQSESAGSAVRRRESHTSSRFVAWRAVWCKIALSN
jgi:hypothetical protein